MNILLIFKGSIKTLNHWRSFVFNYSPKTPAVNFINVFARVFCAHFSYERLFSSYVLGTSKKRAWKTLVKLTPRVNFTNVFCARFCGVFHTNVFQVTFCFACKKRTWKTLVKSTPGVYFIYVLSTHFIFSTKFWRYKSQSCVLVL